MKKKVSLATITCVGISALISILALFGILKLKGITLSFLFTFLALTVAGILTLNSCEMLEKKNKTALISLGLIGLSTFLVVLCFWTKLDDTEAYMKLTLVTSTLSICFSLISSNILKFGKSYKPLQITAYCCYSIVALHLSLTFLSITKLEGLSLKIFILFIILAFVSMCLLAIFSKKLSGETQSVEYIKITKQEYETLLAQKAQLERLLKEGK